MTRRRWIADEVSGTRAALVGDHAAHLARVLRARVGQRFDIASGGRVRSGRVTSVSDTRGEFELGGEVEASPAAHVTVLLAVFKFDRMEWAIEKLTELGVARIVPLIARRTDARLAAAAARRVERWRRIALQAAEQSRRASPPEIAAPARLKEALAGAEGLRVVLAESEDHRSLKEALASAATQPLVLAIGPEGGWTEDELASFTAVGWLTASLGPNVLRAETAAIAAVAVLLAEL